MVPPLLEMVETLAASTPALPKLRCRLPQLDIILTHVCLHKIQPLSLGEMSLDPQKALVVGDEARHLIPFRFKS